jgi:hypothetical protein
MDLIEIAKEIGILPIRIAQTNGGEFVSSCPKCGDGGKNNNSDRFHIWPDEKAKNCIGRYWCRQCEIHGDAIQFCRDFLGLSYAEACSKLKVEFQHYQRNIVRDLTKFQRKFEAISKPNSLWQAKASVFTLWCHDMLWKHPESLELLKARGFSEEAIIRWQFGYSPHTFWRKRSDWGLDDKFNNNGYLAKLWLPKGIVIPTFSDEGIIKLKIRRPDEPQSVGQNKFQKYVIVSSNVDAPSVYGDPTKPILIMESEFDAMLTYDAVGSLYCVIALGGAQKKPDLQLHEHLKNNPKILLSLDFDESGMSANYFWKSLYPQLIIWPVPMGKSPGDAIKLGIDLKKWIKTGLESN